MLTTRVARWLASASTIMLAASPAFAQRPPDTAKRNTQASPEKQAEQADRNVSAANGNEGQIIITAQRRAESQLTVPISVTALTQKSLDTRGVKDFTDIVRSTPGLVYDVTQTTTNISIRGINSTVGAATTGVYIDDTPIQVRNVGYGGGNIYPTIFDLARVEVLRGPQGTLFGAGSMGGTIRFITPKPDMASASAYGRAELAGVQYGAASYELGVAYGAPIVADTLGFRVSAFHRHDGGWVDRVRAEDQSVVDKNSNYQDVSVVRGAFTWKPVPDLQITPSVLYQKFYINDTPVSWDKIADVPFSDYSQGKFLNGNWVQQWDRDRFALPALNIEYDFGNMALIAIGSYFDRKQTFQSDYTVYDQSLFTGALGGVGISLPIFPGQSAHSNFLNTQKNWTGEIRLQSTKPNSRLNWVIGTFWTSAKQLSVQQVEDLWFPDYVQLYIPEPYYSMFFPPLVDGRLIYDQKTSTVDKQLALFGQVNFKVTPQLELLLGARYSSTKFNIESFAQGPVVGTPAIDTGSQKEHPITPKIGINFQANPNTLFYASATKGFRPGGYNPQVGAPCGPELASLGFPNGRPPLYNSDSVWSYEVGAKGRPVHGLTVQASAYQIDWKNIQQGVVLNSCGFQFTGNLGSARVRGFDLQADLHPAEGLTLSAMVAYTNGKFLDTIRLGDAVTSLVSKGDHLPAPPWTISLLAQYEHPISAQMTGYVVGNYDYRSHQNAITPFLNPANTGGIFLTPGNPPAIHYLALRVGARYKNFDISVFVNNLLNEKPWTRRYYDNGFSDIRYSAIVKPRMFGLTAAYRY